MAKRLWVRGVLALIILAAVTATVDAGFIGVRFRGDYQILSNDPGVVRAWVTNCGCFNRFALVSVVAQLPDGSLAIAKDTVFSTTGTDRPVDVTFKGPITLVDRVIVTPLGTVGPKRRGCFLE